MSALPSSCWAVYFAEAPDLVLVLFEGAGTVWAAGQERGPYFEQPAVTGNFALAGKEIAPLWEVLKSERTVEGVLQGIRDRGFTVAQTPSTLLRWAIRNVPEPVATKPPPQNWR